MKMIKTWWREVQVERRKLQVKAAEARLKRRLIQLEIAEMATNR